MSKSFESSLEKVARLIAQQWGIQVIFEGNGKPTDGKTITLPSVPELSPEAMNDLNGYLDSQAAQCKYTDFNELKNVLPGKGKEFHQQLLSVTEERRAQKKLVEELPGCKYNLDPLNDKLEHKQMEKWEQLPWEAKTVLSVRDKVENKDAEVDPTIKPIIDSVEQEIDKIRRAGSTKELRDATAELTEKILQHIKDKEQKENKPEEKDEDKKDPKKDPAGGEPKPGEPGGDEEDQEPGSQMMGEGDWKKFDMTAADMVSKEVAQEAKEYGKKSGRPPLDGTKRRHVPATTRFDTVDDFTGIGNATHYRALKNSVQKHIAPTKRTLEKMLKVIENAKWRPDRERGLIEPRTLSKLVAEQGFRKPFKERTKVEVNNVAIEILVDMSGSMGNKMDTAKATVIVLAEALQELGIAFEVTGFYSSPTMELLQWLHANPTILRDPKYNRKQEALHTFIFKRFDSINLSGIEKISVGQQNPDGEAVRWAANRLLQQKQKRKILFVLSDGEPATGEGNPSILHYDLKETVERMPKYGIEVVGIGIQTDSVADYYPDHVIVNNIEELPIEAMNKLSKVILKNFMR